MSTLSDLITEMECTKSKHSCFQIEIYFAIVFCKQYFLFVRVRLKSIIIILVCLGEEVLFILQMPRAL